jgi:hypothetical protein
MKIILTELATDKLKAEADMEQAINSNDSSETKTQIIKSSLKKIIETEQMIVKWQDYLSANEESNNE